jgi:hypothetical protein
MGTLLQQQRRFARALSGDPNAALPDLAAMSGLSADARLAVYANNVRLVFEEALRQTFPVVEARVGSEYFRQLSRAYRAAHPSLGGDLHEVGRAFPDWLAVHLADTDYAWLADLAALEWASADAACCTPGEPVAIDVLAGVPPERLAELRLIPCASMRWVCSDWPVFSVWQANQPGADAAPVDAALGGQGVLLRATHGAPVMHRVDPELARFVGFLAQGLALGQALDASSLPVEALAGALAFLFTEGYLVAARLPTDPCASA